MKSTHIAKTEDKWGAFLWTMQNQIFFLSSETNRWPFGGGKVLITNVMVGNLGNYPALTQVSDTGPDLSPAFNTYPGDNQGDEGNYQVDLTTYQLAIPEIAVMPKEAVTVVGGNAVQFTATGVNIPSGVMWAIDPEGAGAELQANGYTANVTPGVTPMIYRVIAASVDCPNLYDEAKLTVCEVESIEPDPASLPQEIDDNDGNPKTRVFLVQVRQSGVVTVTAEITPSIDEASLPDCMTLQGGNGLSKLVRTIDRTTPAKTDFTFSYCSVDSGFKTTVYVYDASIWLYADKGNGLWDWPWTNKYGHSWWRIETDPNSRELIADNLARYVNRNGGYWPTISGDPVCPGVVRFDNDAAGSRSPTGLKKFQIPYNHLISALDFVRYMVENATTYDFFEHNRTDVAVDVGEHGEVYTIDTSGVTTPKALSDWLNTH